MSWLLLLALFYEPVELEVPDPLPPNVHRYSCAGWQFPCPDEWPREGFEWLGACNYVKAQGLRCGYNQPHFYTHIYNPFRFDPGHEDAWVHGLAIGAEDVFVISMHYGHDPLCSYRLEW